jgi:hypothetical protein
MFGTLFPRTSSCLGSSIFVIDADTSPPEVNNQSITPSASEDTVVLAVESSTVTPKLTTTKKSGREGHEKEDLAYSTAEHLALLGIISDVPDSFNSSKSSDEYTFRWC